MNSHKDLDVWKDSIILVKHIYKITDRFPSNEKFGLVNQIRRSSVSIPSNIAEGAGRRSKKEFIQFLYIALGSLSELETQLIISKELNYLTESNFENKLNSIRKMLIGLIDSIKL